MSKSVHGLDVLNLIKETGNGLSKESLIEAIKAHYGTDTHYHVCVKEGMTAEELFGFLVNQNLLLETGSGFSVPENIPCSC